MLHLSKNSGSVFEKIYFQRTIGGLNQKLVGLNRHRVELLARLPKEKQAQLLNELGGLERLTERVIKRMKPTELQFVKLQIGDHRLLVSQAVMVRKKRFDKSSVHRLSIRGKMSTITNHLHRIALHWDTYHRTIHSDARNHLMEIFMILNRKYSMYLNSLKIQSNVKNNKKITPVSAVTKNEQNTKAPTKNQGRNQSIKVRDKTTVKASRTEGNKTVEKPKKPALMKGTAKKIIENKAIPPKITPPKSVVEKKTNNKTPQETNQPKKQRTKPKKLVEQKPIPLLEDDNEIYLDSLMDDEESSNVETQVKKRNMYMDEMFLQ